MKRNLPFEKLTTVLFCVLFAVHSFAQTSKTSIAAGNWNDPQIWSPAGVPTPSDDTININTAVTFNQNIVFGQSMFRVNLGGALIDQGYDTIALGGDYARIFGYLSCDVLAIGMTGAMNNYGTISVNSDMSQSDVFYNETSGKICVGQSLNTSDNFTNYGSISTNNWTNSGLANGTGMYCIANYFINVMTISGTLDICDATPNTPFDVNAGTIAGTITHCTLGPCALCPQPTGMEDGLPHGIPISIYPNPFSSEVQIKIDPALLSSGTDLSFEIYDMNGKCVKKMNVSSSIILLDRENMADGIYFYRLLLNEHVLTSGKLFAE